MSISAKRINEGRLESLTWSSSSPPSIAGHRRSISVSFKPPPSLRTSWASGRPQKASGASLLCSLTWTYLPYVARASAIATELRPLASGPSWPPLPLHRIHGDLPVRVPASRPLPRGPYGAPPAADRETHSGEVGDSPFFLLSFSQRSRMRESVCVFITGVKMSKTTHRRGQTALTVDRTEP